MGVWTSVGVDYVVLVLEVVVECYYVVWLCVCFLYSCYIVLSYGLEQDVVFVGGVGGVVYVLCAKASLAIVGGQG